MAKHEPVISITNVSKIYGKKAAAFRALNDVSLSIAAGESLAIVGKSGSGKSTLMHILALLDQPSSGTVKIEGRDATKLKQRDINRLRNQKFGFVFQQFFMNARDTVLNNVMLPLKIAGVPYRERRRRALEALRVVELNDKAKSRARDLSGGQKQRVCIARAIANHPSVIFADEPTGNLDSATGQKVEDLLFDLNKNQGITLIIVTHDDDLAERCSRRIFLRDGRILPANTKGEI
jgi:putative ABC transport system ATP-binding protein